MPAAHHSSKPFLISADTASLADYPAFVVLISTRHGLSKKHCSGVRIAPHFVVTSASCLFPNQDLEDITPENASEQHVISSLQFLSLGAKTDDSDIKVRTIRRGGIYRVDVHPYWAKANLEHTELMIHDLALITHTQDEGDNKNAFIPLADDIDWSSTLTLYGMAKSIEQGDLSKSKDAMFAKALANKDDDFFRHLIEKINEKEKTTELASIITEDSTKDEEITTLDAEKEREKAALIKITQTYTELDEFFKQTPTSLMVSTKNEEELRLPPGICREDRGGPVVAEGSLVAIIGDYTNKNWESKSRKKTLANLIANAMVDFTFCHSNTQIHSIAPHKEWLESLMKKNLDVISTDSALK